MADPIPGTLFDIYAEAACIGLLLLGQERAIEVLSELKSEDFGVGDNWRIFKCAEALKETGEEISFINLRHQLEQNDWLERVGEANLRKLGMLNVDEEGQIRLGPEDAMHFASVKAAIAKVKNKASIRKLLQKIEKSAEGIRNLEVTAQDVCSDLKDALIENVSNASAAVSATTLSNRMRDHISLVQSGVQVAEPIGFEGFDAVTGGLRGGDVLLICGLPKGGKSALSLIAADNLAQRNIPGGYFSLEMDELEQEQRRLVRRAALTNWQFTPYEGIKLTLSKLRGGYKMHMSQEEAQMAIDLSDTISKEPFYFFPPSVRNRKDIFMAAQRLVNEKGAKWFAIDHAQLVRDAGSEREVLVKLAQEAKAFANDNIKNGVFVILLSQLSSDGVRMARATQRISSDDAYGSGELQKSSTIITNIWLESPKFTCDCADQEVSVPTGRLSRGDKQTVVTRRRHDFRPSTGVCAGCNGFVKEVSEREGGWYIERSRSSAEGVMIPLLFDGSQMNLTEII